MKNLIKKTLKLFLLVVLVALLRNIQNNNHIFAQTEKNKVPDYYYANYKFADDWDAILDRFTKAKAKYSVNQDIPTSEFAQLAQHFRKVFPNLTKDYSLVYEKCQLLADDLAKNYSHGEMEALMWNSCYNSLTQAINMINSSYTVIPSVTSNPSDGMAPLTVTFDARNSTDPSLETIPADNFYRYYRDEKWVDRPIWQWQLVSYAFNEPGKFIVHLVVRSSNVNQWILDWERNLTINVTPKATDIVVYANTRMLSKNFPLKLWIEEGKKWIVFDWSLTKPRWWREIVKHRWIITSNWETKYDSKDIDGKPRFINQPLDWDWLFKITLITIDNEGTTVSEDFYVYLSDPVTIIKQSPEQWTTSTIFNFDGSASYSITSRISSYIWEVFDWNWDENNWKKILMYQGKSMDFNWNNKIKPWNYMVKLTVTDATGSQNVETKELYVESTTPSPQFTVTPTSKREYPSEFTLDASNTTDIDVNNWVDSLEYKWEFSTDNAKIISTENNNEKIVVQFNEKGTHTVSLTTTDQYWKSASTTKTIDVKSTLRPEIEIIPGPITWEETLQLKSSVNKPVSNYSWDFWDGKENSSQHLTELQHKYGGRWIYSVKLTVTSEDWEESNTVTEKAFIWEINHPIVHYTVTDDNGFYIQSSETCNDSWTKVEAYPVNRLDDITINPWKSVNTKWTTNWLEYVFEKEVMMGPNQAKITSEFSTNFNQLWCHYVDLTVKDSNIWKQDRRRVWFNVKNALPKLKSVSLSFPQNANSVNAFWITSTNSNQTVFTCSWSSNLTIKVTAVEPTDPDWNISRLRFYYYNIDDPSRILEYKESLISVPYVYFILPRISWEYKFWVMVYDNDWWMINSDEYLASNPSIYFSSDCENVGIPMVTLKLSSTNIQVWDTVTYSVVSKVSTDNTDDFETDRTFYYDFEWDGEWDLVTKNDTVTHTFDDAYEDWIKPKAAVEYRWKLWEAYWDTIYVKNWIKPVLLTNVCGNIVIFRDMSVWLIQQREICFEKSECDAGHTKFKKVLKVPTNELIWWTWTTITQNDFLMWNYDNYWEHNVSMHLKSKYWIDVNKDLKVKTSSDKNEWKIAPGINIITIPETTFTNGNPEIFLSEAMNNALVIYINNENWEMCYVDTDIATDSDWDWKSDNDINIQCNKIAKIKYEPGYETAIWRVYYTDKWNLTFKNFYVTFAWIISQLDDEKKAIYNDITTLVNWIEDLPLKNTDLKSLLDKLRKNLNNRSEVTSLVNTINEQIQEWWIKLDSNQKELLDSVLSRLSNEDTTGVFSVWMNEYEKNKRDIIAWLEWSLKSTIEKIFKDFEDNSSNYSPKKRADELEKIRQKIINDTKTESVFTPYFCNIFDYYDITLYTKKCWWIADSIKDNYEKADEESVSGKSKFPLRLKIILIILVWWLLTMWWVIVFFSIKAKLNTDSENDDEE